MKRLERKLIIYAVITMMLVGLFSAISFAQSYPDVRQSDWFYKNVTEMSNDGYLKGYPDGSFKPNATISAAEFVSVVTRVAKLAPGTAKVDHWAGDNLGAAMDIGWYDWDEIVPSREAYDSIITRQLAVKIVMNAFLPDATGDYNTESAKMKDFSSLDGRYYNAVLAAYAKGVAGGDDKGNFNPKNGLSRAEACALITRAVRIAGGTPSDIPQVNPANPGTGTDPTNPANPGTGTDPTNPENPGTGTDPTNPGTATDPSTPVTPGNNPSENVSAIKGGVKENGQLTVSGTQLVNSKGQSIVLRGMSSHGIQWFPQFLTKDCIKSTADNGANLFRIAMYTGEGGYIQNPAATKKLVNDTVATVTSLDMYCIIDWHILSDGNPQTYKAQAVSFFSEMAEKYKDNPAVIYEICNEPNGNVSWSKDVKPYAEEIIKVIRAKAPNAVILIGSPTWSQDLHMVAADPIKANNIMYTCHFYSGTHTQWLRDRITDVRKKGIPVFISEWGTSDASGGGGVYEAETKAWLEYLDKNNISWANWSLCDKNESSACVKSGANLSDGISSSELSASGKIVWAHFSR